MNARKLNFLCFISFVSDSWVNFYGNIGKTLLSLVRNSCLLLICFVSLSCSDLISNRYFMYFYRSQCFSISSSCFNTMCCTQRRKPKLFRTPRNLSLILLMNMFKDWIQRRRIIRESLSFSVPSSCIC